MTSPALNSASGEAVVVCGAGAGGIAAALAAARTGARVLLLESGAQIGGTVVGALIHTLGGLYDGRGELINGGLPTELAARLFAADARTRVRRLGRAWVLSVCPNTYFRTVTRWIDEHDQITVLRGARVTRIMHRAGQIHEVQITAAGRSFRQRTAALIDATGAAEVVRQLDGRLVDADGSRAAGGWIVRLRGLPPGALEFPRGLAIIRALREAARRGELPWQCEHAWIDQGIDEDEAFLKLFVPLDGGWRQREDEISRAADEAAQSCVALLRKWPDLARIEIAHGGVLGIRDGGRIRGRYQLTADDVRSSRKFHDAACRCDWPIEYWDPERGVSLEYLPAGSHYEIPMRSLQIDGIDNLWVVGKCLSADRLAHASARVVGACWAMGQAAGAAAGDAARTAAGQATGRGEARVESPLELVSTVS